MRNLILVLGELLGLNLLFRCLNADKIRVLMYHGVTTQGLGAPCWTVLDRGTFEWQMHYASRRYNVAPVSTVFAGDLSPSGSLRHMVVITLDDGLENTYSEVWPILRRLGLSAICFCVPGLSERRAQIWADDVLEFCLTAPSQLLDLGDLVPGGVTLAGTAAERVMLAGELIGRMKTWPDVKRRELTNRLLADPDTPHRRLSGIFQLMTIEQIAELADSAEFDIGLHSDKHPIMSQLSTTEQELEVKSAMDRLNRHDIRFQPVFAYPNGREQDFNDDSVAVLKKLGFKAAVTTLDGLWDRNADRFRIRRIAIGAGITKWEFKARLSGFFYFLTGKLEAWRRRRTRRVRTPRE